MKGNCKVSLPGVNAAGRAGKNFSRPFDTGEERLYIEENFFTPREEAEPTTLATTAVITADKLDLRVKVPGATFLVSLCFPLSRTSGWRRTREPQTAQGV
jgi:hypothetical protein